MTVGLGAIAPVVIYSIGHLGSLFVNPDSQRVPRRPMHWAFFSQSACGKLMYAKDLIEPRVGMLGLLRWLCVLSLASIVKSMQLGSRPWYSVLLTTHKA